METPGKPRILVVDDDRRSLDRTLDAIRRHGVGYEARTAAGGFEALDYLFARGRFHERGRHPLPDLILLDLDMEPLDGLEVLQRIADALHLPDIPVAILCASEHERERALRETAGRCACVLKPISPETFEELLRALSRRSEPAPLEPSTLSPALSQGRGGFSSPNGTESECPPG